MKRIALLVILMAIAIFAVTDVAIADVSTTLDSPIQNLYQELISARNFANIQSGTIEGYVAGDKVRFQPILTDIDIQPGWVKCYAAYLEGDKIYIAQKGPDNNIVFKAYNGESEIPYYDTEYFYGGTWTPNAYFEALGDSFAINNRTFIFGIAPKSVQSVQDFVDHFHGQWIALKKATSASTGSSGGTTETPSTTNKPSDQVLCFLGGGQWMIDMKCVGAQTVSDQKYCTLNGGTWENNQCTPNTAKSMETLFCAFSGGSWNSSTNTCTVTAGRPYPSPITPSSPQPTPAASCQAAGGLWINNQCMMPGTDTDKIICVSTGGTWVDNHCENNQYLCEANGGVWAPPVAPATIGTCYTAAQLCSMDGGVWQNNQCYSEAEWCVATGGTWSSTTTPPRCISKAEMSCLPPNVWQNNSCYTPQAACSLTGGVWQNNACYPDAITACAALPGIWDPVTNQCYLHCVPPQVWEPVTQLCYNSQAEADCAASHLFWSATTNACYPTQEQANCADSSGVWANNTCYADMTAYCTAIGKTYDPITNTCK